MALYCFVCIVSTLKFLSILFSSATEMAYSVFPLDVSEYRVRCNLQ